MAIFTSNEADASKIHVAESVSANGTFTHWTFVVTDSSGNRYSWEDTTANLDQSGAPTDQQVSTYIKRYLTGINDYDGVEKVTTSPVKRTVTVKTSLDQIAPGGSPTAAEDNETA